LIAALAESKRQANEDKPLWLTTEEQGELPDITIESLNEIIAAESFGKFAVLSASDEAFIQTASDWSPSKECTAFLKRYGSDPWILEYRDSTSHQQFRVRGHLTLNQVQQAFASYLQGDNRWQSDHEWIEINE
jgi:hypothetical protein